MILAAFFIFAALGSLTIGRHPVDLGWPYDFEYPGYDDDPPLTVDELNELMIHDAQERDFERGAYD